MTHRTATGARAVGRMPSADSGISARVALRSARLSARLAWTAAPLGCVASVLFMIISGVTPAANAWLQREILDALVEAPAVGRQAPGRARADLLQGPLLWIAITLCGLALVTAMVPYARRYIESEMRRRLGLLVQDNVYRAINSFPGMERFESPRFADKLQLAQQVANGTGNSFVGSVLGIGQALISAVTLGLTLLCGEPGDGRPGSGGGGARGQGAAAQQRHAGRTGLAQ